MKNITLFLSILIVAMPGFGQGVFSNQTNFVLEKVVQEYTSQFKNIKGEVINKSKASTAYKSTLAIPGAVFYYHYTVCCRRAPGAHLGISIVYRPGF